MFCPNCASKIEGNQNFCAQCGHSFEDWSDPSLQKDLKRKNRKIWFYIIVLLTLGLTFWGFHSLFFSSDDLETVAKAQLNEIQKNQITKAYYEYSSSQFKNQISLLSITLASLIILAYFEINLTRLPNFKNN